VTAAMILGHERGYEELSQKKNPFVLH